MEGPRTYSQCRPGCCERTWSLIEPYICSLLVRCVCSDVVGASSLFVPILLPVDHDNSGTLLSRSDAPDHHPFLQSAICMTQHMHSFTTIVHKSHHSSLYTHIGSAHCSTNTATSKSKVVIQMTYPSHKEVLSMIIIISSDCRPNSGLQRVIQFIGPFWSFGTKFRSIREDNVSVTNWNRVRGSRIYQHIHKFLTVSAEKVSAAGRGHVYSRSMKHKPAVLRGVCGWNCGGRVGNAMPSNLNLVNRFRKSIPSLSMPVKSRLDLDRYRRIYGPCKVWVEIGNCAGIGD